MALNTQSSPQRHPPQQQKVLTVQEYDKEIARLMSQISSVSSKPMRKRTLDDMKKLESTRASLIAAKIARSQQLIKDDNSQWFNSNWILHSKLNL